MSHFLPLLAFHVGNLRDRAGLRRRSRLAFGQRGEGVISTGIAVLIVAALGALMWVGFQELWLNASTQTAEQISQIGQ